MVIGRYGRGYRFREKGERELRGEGERESSYRFISLFVFS